MEGYPKSVCLRAEDLEAAADHPHVLRVEAGLRSDEDDLRLARDLSVTAAQAYSPKHAQRTEMFILTEYGMQSLRRKLKTAHVPVNPQNLTVKALSVMKDAATCVTAYYGCDPGWAESPRFPDVVDLVVALGRKKTRLLVKRLREHARYLAEFCDEQGLVAVVEQGKPYARMTHRTYVRRLLIAGAAYMVRTGCKKQMIEIAYKGDPVPLLTAALGSRSKPFFEALLRAQPGQFAKGRCIFTRQKERFGVRPQRSKSRANRVHNAQRSRARNRRQPMMA